MNFETVQSLNGFASVTRDQAGPGVWTELIDRSLSSLSAVAGEIGEVRIVVKLKVLTRPVQAQIQIRNQPSHEKRVPDQN